MNIFIKTIKSDGLAHPAYLVGDGDHRAGLACPGKDGAVVMPNVQPSPPKP